MTEHIITSFENWIIYSDKFRGLCKSRSTLPL